MCPAYTLGIFVPCFFHNVPCLIKAVILTDAGASKSNDLKCGISIQRTPGLGNIASGNEVKVWQCQPGVKKSSGNKAALPRGITPFQNKVPGLRLLLGKLQLGFSEFPGSRESTSQVDVAAYIE